MDPKDEPHISKLLKKQYALMQQAHDKMAQELHRAQVEEEVLMRQLYEQMSKNRGIMAKNPRTSNSNDEDNGGSNGLPNTRSENKQ